MGVDIGYLEGYIKNKGYQVNSFFDETEFENEAKNADVSIIAYIRLDDLNHISGHFITFYPIGDTDPADGSMRYRFFNAGESISNGNTINRTGIIFIMMGLLRWINCWVSTENCRCSLL